MRTSLVLLAGVCLLTPSLAQAQSTAKPVTQPATTAQPQNPPPAAAKPNAERKEITLPEKVLQTYVGEYEMAPGRVLAITLEKGSLWGQPGEQTKRQLFAESNTKFFLKDLDVQLTFEKNAEGAVTGLQMVQRGGEPRPLKKIK